MFSVIRRHDLYYWLYVLFFVVMLWYQFNEPQFEAIYFFSAHRSVFADFFFTWITELGSFAPYVVALIVFIFLKNKEQVMKIAITAVLTAIFSYALKIFFLHDRPGTILEHEHLLNTINWVPSYGILKGHFSFPSGHSMSAFAFWTTIAFYFNSQRSVNGLKLEAGSQNLIFISLCFIIAVLVCISRMYLGAHFPQDVITGSFIGITIATFVEYLVNYQLQVKN